MLDLHQKIFDLNEVELERMEVTHSSNLATEDCQLHIDSNFKDLGFTDQAVIEQRIVRESRSKQYTTWSRRSLEMKLV